MSDQSGMDIINSGKYCPAGKCECELWDNFHNHCHLHGGTFDVDWEVCPWPSRQVRVEPVEELGTNRIYANGYAAGRAYQSGKDVEAVNGVVPFREFDCSGNVIGEMLSKPEAIAALREAGKGE